jgi:3',5'-cyclic AMP phosphodiesterase CpdA
LKLAWLTDIHLEFATEEAAAALCAAVAGSGADAVLLGGDIADARSLESWFSFLEERLERPIYFVLGNHDYYHGTVAEVRRRVAALAAGSGRLRWLEERGVEELTERSCLVGHGGWGDARYGDFEGSRVLLNDFRLIADLAGLGWERLGARLRGLGDEAAAHLRRLLPEALERYEHVVVLMHVPPFRETSWHEGRISSDDYLPFFACKAAGDVLLEALRGRPDRQATVLCGHTHSPGEARPLPNLLVRTGAAVYRRPALQGILDVP